MNVSTNIILRTVNSPYEEGKAPRVGEICYIRDTDTIASMTKDDVIHVQKWGQSKPTELIIISDSIGSSNDPDIFPVEAFEGQKFVSEEEVSKIEKLGNNLTNTRMGEKVYIIDDKIYATSQYGGTSIFDFEGNYLGALTNIRSGSSDYCGGYWVYHVDNLYASPSYRNIYVFTEDDGIILDIPNLVEVGFTSGYYKFGKYFTIYNDELYLSYERTDNSSGEVIKSTLVYDLNGELINELSGIMGHMQFDEENDVVVVHLDTIISLYRISDFSLIHHLTIPGTGFYSVAIGEGMIVVGDGGRYNDYYRQGIVYLYNYTSPTPLRLIYRPSTYVLNFGWEVQIDSGRIMVGVSRYHGYYGPGYSAHTKTGAAFMYNFSGNLIKSYFPPEPFFGGNHNNGKYLFGEFGFSVAMKGSKIVIGSPGDGDFGYDPYDGWVRGSLFFYNDGMSIVEYVFKGGSWEKINWGETREYIEERFEPNYHNPEDYPFLGKYSTSMEEGYFPTQDSDVVTREYIDSLLGEQVNGQPDPTYLELDGGNVMAPGYSPDHPGDVVTKKSSLDETLEFVPMDYNPLVEGVIWNDNGEARLSGIELIQTLDVWNYPLSGDQMCIDQNYFGAGGRVWNMNDWSVKWTAPYTYTYIYGMDISDNLVGISCAQNRTDGLPIFDLDSGDILFTILDPNAPASNNFGGKSIQITSDRIMIGATWDSTDGTSKGALHLFQRDGTFISTRYGSWYRDGFGANPSVNPTNDQELIIGDRFSSSSKVHIARTSDLITKNYSTGSGSETEEVGTHVAMFGRNVIFSDPEYGNSGRDWGRVWISSKFFPTLKILEYEDPQQMDRFGSSVAVNDTLYFVGFTKRHIVCAYNLSGEKLFDIIVDNIEGNDFGRAIRCNNDYLFVSTSTKIYVFDLNPHKPQIV